jgi:peroxiredoxin Q/BCP
MRPGVALRLAAALLGCALSAPIAWAQGEPKERPSTPPPADAQARVPRARLRAGTALTVGDPAPDFELADPDGHPIRLLQLRGAPVLLCFADRKEDFLPLRDAVDSLRAAHVQVVGVSRQQPQSLHRFAEHDRFAITLLADGTGDVASLYGLYDSLHSAVLPGFLVLDRDGVVLLAVLGRTLPPDQIVGITRYVLTSR